MDILTNTLGAADPTGVLPAAGAAISLVGTVLRAVPALKTATHAMKGQSISSSGPNTLHRAQTAFPAAEIGVDPERERRAYETVNFVLRELGSRICAAGLVDEHALTNALNSAAQHIDFNLFSGEANRLFASLAPKLGDPILVNSVFTSIYFIGALNAELARSLPNYKDTYTPLGPRIVQQLFRTAIGEDAFRENLTGNLDAYKTLATTAGLLRPTDIGYSAFPGFPAFSPCRYSSRSFNDVRNNKSTYEKLVKHFDRSGFPQPIPARQAEVGIIKEWRFLAGNTPSRTVEVERADKNIGESFGRVLHWLLCSADRLPPGQAVIAYYDQHIELVKWIGQRMGYCVLYSATDLDWSGVHLQLDRKIRAVSDTWVILMPSERAQATRRASSAQWSQSHISSVPQAVPAQATQPQRQSFQSTSLPQAENEVETSPIISAGSPTQAPSTSPHAVGSHIPTRKQSSAKTIEQRLDDVETDFNNNLLPQCNRFLTTPPLDTNARDMEFIRLTQHIEKVIIGWLDEFPIPDGHPARVRRKAMIIHAQQVLAAFGRTPQPAPKPTSQDVVELTGSAPATEVQAWHASTTSPPNASPSQSPPHPLAAFSPPPYSPTSPPSTASSTNPSTFSFPEKPPVKTAIRRKAPPPPKKFIAAKALYDFEPDSDNDEEMAFKEGDDIEIIEKNATLDEEGWCRARVKGTKKIGLVPLEYLEIEQIVSGPMQATAPNRLSSAPSTSLNPPAQTTSHTQMGQQPHASSVSHAGLPPQQPGPSSPAAHTTMPHTHPQPSNPNHTMDKLGKKLEVAGLGVATVGVASGVITAIRSEHQSRDSNYNYAHPITEAPHQWQNPIYINQQRTPETLLRNQQPNPTNAFPINYPIFIPKPPPSTVPTRDKNNINNNNNNNNSLPPTTDLSAFSSPPFSPQPPITETPQFTPWTTTNPYPTAPNPSPSAFPPNSSTTPTPTSTDLPRSFSPPLSNISYSSTPPPPPQSTSYTTPPPASSTMTSFAAPTSISLSAATEDYATPLASPIESPNLMADDQVDDEADDAVAFAQLSTDSIVDDDDEMDGAIAAGQDYDGDDGCDGIVDNGDVDDDDDIDGGYNS